MAASDFSAWPRNNGAAEPRGFSGLAPRGTGAKASAHIPDAKESPRPQMRIGGFPVLWGSCVAGFGRRPRSILLSPYEARPACWGDCGAQPSFRVQNRHFRAIACRTCAKLTVLYAKSGSSLAHQSPFGKNRVWAPRVSPGQSAVLSAASRGGARCVHRRARNAYKTVDFMQLSPSSARKRRFCTQ